MSEERLIVGLGNPGEEYRFTRHNLGFLITECLASRYKLGFRSSRLCRGHAAAGEIEGVGCHLLLPATFMNKSGEAVKPFVAKKKISLSSMLVVCDDINLPFGEIRLRRRGSGGGHNGLSSVIEQLGSDDFGRLRVGIGGPADKEQTVDFVLGEFTRGEKDKLDKVIEESCECCLAWLTLDMEQAMRRFN